MKIETKLHKGGHPPQFRGENTFFSFQKKSQILWFWVDTKIIKKAEIYFSSWTNFISAFFTN
jgi:hypothetical protein